MQSWDHNRQKPNLCLPHHISRICYICIFAVCIEATSIVHSKLDYCNFPFLQHQLFSNETPANNSEHSCPRNLKNSQTSPHNFFLQITSLAKSPPTHPLQTSRPISYLQCSSNLSILLYSIITHRKTARVYSLIIIPFSISASSLIVLKFCARSFIMLRQLFGSAPIKNVAKKTLRTKCRHQNVAEINVA